VWSGYPQVPKSGILGLHPNSSEYFAEKIPGISIILVYLLGVRVEVSLTAVKKGAIVTE
jgi:hypothetical protein